MEADAGTDGTRDQVVIELAIHRSRDGKFDRLEAVRSGLKSVAWLKGSRPAAIIRTREKDSRNSRIIERLARVARPPGATGEPFGGCGAPVSMPVRRPQRRTAVFARHPARGAPSPVSRGIRCAPGPSSRSRARFKSWTARTASCRAGSWISRAPGGFARASTRRYRDRPVSSWTCRTFPIWTRRGSR
jgi:hypothetical protein